MKCERSLANDHPATRTYQPPHGAAQPAILTTKSTFITSRARPTNKPPTDYATNLTPEIFQSSNPELSTALTEP